MSQEIFEFSFNGEKVAFHKDSKIFVQIAKGKNAYKNRYGFLACEFGMAVFHYNAINIGNGYRKRLYCETLNKPVLARYAEREKYALRRS